MIRILIGAVALLSLPAITLAQDGSPTKAELDAASAARKAQREGRYLDAAEALRPLAFDAAGKPKPGFAYDRWVEFQTRMTTEPAHAKEERHKLNSKTTARLRAATARDAITEIVAGAKSTRVVILNEDHGLPRDRAFGLEVARALRPLGYNVLAVETLTNGGKADEAARASAAVVRDGYVRQTSGYYSADPVFGDFLRQALALGYRPYAYEVTDDMSNVPPDEQIEHRETAQATYLAKALIADPATKFFVYVGYSHASEAPITGYGDKPTTWMAGRLRKMTGIDPLTIDQTTLAENPSFDRTDGYDLVADRAKGRSITLFERAKPLVIGQYAGAVDLQVVHPRTRLIDGRPDWLRGMGRTPVTVPQNLLPTRGTRLVQAFVAGEAADAIPVDQVLVTAGQRPPALMLPRAPVRYAVQDPAVVK